MKKRRRNKRDFLRRKGEGRRRFPKLYNFKREGIMGWGKRFIIMKYCVGKGTKIDEFYTLLEKKREKKHTRKENPGKGVPLEELKNYLEEGHWKNPRGEPCCKRKTTPRHGKRNLGDGAFC